MPVWPVIFSDPMLSYLESPKSVILTSTESWIFLTLVVNNKLAIILKFLLQWFKISVNYRRVVSVQKLHSFRNIQHHFDPLPPWECHSMLFMQEGEESASWAVFSYYADSVLHFACSHEDNQIRMMQSHKRLHFSSKFLHCFFLQL